MIVNGFVPPCISAPPSSIEIISPVYANKMSIFIIFFISLVSLGCSATGHELTEDIEDQKHRGLTLNRYLSESRVLFSRNLVDTIDHCKRMDVDPIHFTPGSTCRAGSPKKLLRKIRRNSTPEILQKLELNREKPGWENATHLVVIDEMFPSCYCNKGNCGISYDVTAVPYDCDNS
jgi:hypothetical protein